MKTTKQLTTVLLSTVALMSTVIAVNDKVIRIPINIVERSDLPESSLETLDVMDTSNKHRLYGNDDCDNTR